MNNCPDELCEKNKEVIKLVEKAIYDLDCIGEKTQKEFIEIAKEKLKREQKEGFVRNIKKTGMDIMGFVPLGRQIYIFLFPLSPEERKRIEKEFSRYRSRTIECNSPKSLYYGKSIISKDDYFKQKEKITGDEK